MLTEQTEITEQFTYGGALSPGGAVALGVLIVLVLIGLAWRDRRSGRLWLLPVLFVLRLVAVCVVLWMLTGPEIMTTTRHSVPKSVLLMVDRSASMGVADPGEDLAMTRRWQVATGGIASSAPFAVLDAAAAALAVAQQQFGQFATACRSTRRTDDVDTAAKRTTTALAAAQGRLDQLLAGNSRLSNTFRDALGAVHAAVAEAALPQLAEITRDAQTGRLQLAGDRDRRLDDLGAALREAAERLSGIADTAADDADATIATEPTAQAPTSRAEKVAYFLGGEHSQWLDQISQQANVIGYLFDEMPEPTSADQWRRPPAVDNTHADQQIAATDLATAFEQVARDAAGQPVALAIWLTDGSHNRDSDPLRAARAAAAVPSYIVPIGNTKPIRDVILHHLQAPRAVFERDVIMIDGTVDAHGCEGQDLAIELLEHDVVIDRTTIAVSGQSAASRIKFQVPTEKLGQRTFRVRVEPVPEEKVIENNEAEVAVEVTEGVIRVFLADHLPRWEWRYLVNLFDRDERIEFASVQFEPLNRGRSPTPQGRGFPQTLDDWSRYRAIILGDLPPAILDQGQQYLLEQYVSERGGTLIIIAGDNAMPQAYVDQTLAPLIPVTADNVRRTGREGFGLFLTAQGRMLSALQLDDDPLSSERLWRELTSRVPVFDLSAYCLPKPTSHVLIAAAQLTAAGQSQERRPRERAYLCWQAYGRGKVVYLASPSTYRLRFRRGDRFHHRFWAQLLRWAVARDMGAGSQTVRLVTDKSQYAAGDDVQVTVYLTQIGGAAVAGARCRAAACTAERDLSTLELTEDEQAPGTYRAQFKDLPAGQIQIRVEGDEPTALLASEQHPGPVEAAITIDPPASLELRHTQCNLPLLTQIAESTGGLIVPPTGLPTALALADLAPEVTKSTARRPLWNRWLWVWVFVGVLTVEWAARKLTGLA